MKSPKNVDSIEHILTDMKGNTLTQKQQKAIKAILETNSIEEAAKKASFSRTSIYNWLKDKDFKECLERERKVLFEEGLSALKGATAKAAKTLVELLESNDKNTRRLAAKEIINFAIKTVEAKELEERVSQLEELIEQNKSYQKRY
jgi:molybdenum-dependent DNA-binding transcriptional regulator ModE